MPNDGRRASRPRPAAGPPRIGAAPGELEIVQRFVNTLDIEAGADELDSAAPVGLAPGAVAGGGGLPGIAADLRTRLEVSEDGRVSVAPAGSGTAAALARILLIVAEAGSNGTWSR